MSQRTTYLPGQGQGRDGKQAGGGGEDPGQRGNKWWTLVAVCLGTFMLLLDVTIVNVALPDIQLALHSSFSDLQWVVDAYALTLAAFLLTAGSLADMYGRRLLYLIGLVLFTFASVLCGFAVSTLMLQLSRALQGVGGAIMFAVSLALLADSFRGKDRGTAFGVWGLVTGLAVAIGPLLGGLLTSGLSWRWIFFVNVPAGIAAVIIVVMKVAESRAPHASRPDWAGFALFTAALSSLIYGLIESNQRSLTDSLVLGCFAAAVGLFVAFVIVELHSRHPMFDLNLFRLPTFSGGSVAAFGLSASIFSMLLYLVLYLQDILGYSPLGTGVRLMVISGGILATSTVAGKLSSHMPVRFLIGPGLILVGVGLLLMRGLDAGSAWTHLIPGMILGGVGIGMVNPPLASTAVGVVAPQRAGHGLGHQLHLPPGRDRHRHRLAGDAVLQQSERRGAGPSDRGTWAIPQWPADRHRRAVRGDRARDQQAARPRPAGRGSDHPGGLHHGPGPHPAGGGRHRAGSRRSIAGRYSQQGLRASGWRRATRMTAQARPEGLQPPPSGIRGAVAAAVLGHSSSPDCSPGGCGYVRTCRARRSR